MEQRMHLVTTSAINIAPKAPMAGLAGWLLAAVRELRTGTMKAPRKQMRVVESLALGAKNRLVLVSCGGERFLVGTGPESVGTIIRVRAGTEGSSALREQR